LISLSAEGLEDAMALVRHLAAIAHEQAISAVELNSVTRDEPGAPSNAELLAWLEEGGRAFAEVGPREAEGIGAAWVAEIESVMARVQERRRGQKTVDTTDAGRALARQIMTKGARAAMREYMRVVVQHIESATGPDGAGLRAPRLSPHYEVEKMRTVGYAYPIGKRSGQLLDNLGDSIPSGKIRVRRES